MIMYGCDYISTKTNYPNLGRFENLKLYLQKLIKKIFSTKNGYFKQTKNFFV